MRGRTAVFSALTILCVTLLLPAGGFAQESPLPPAGAAAYPDGLILSVEQGDTLWDLAAKYLGSPWKWQELWERNRFLTNPHYIYPGTRVVVFPPPAREYAFPAAASAEAPAAPVEAGKAGEQAAAVPPPSSPQTLDILPSEFVRAGEFLKEKPTGIGAIRGGEEPKVAFAEGDRVLLQLVKEIPAGQLLGVYRVRGPITIPGDRRVSGYVKYLAGILQSSGKESGEAFGVVRTSFEDLNREDVISEEIPSYRPVTLSPAPGGTEATAIAGQMENSELAAGNFVFLDRGSSSGVAPGNGFRLFAVGDQSAGTKSEMSTSARVEVGEAVVVRVSPEYSTAYIVKSAHSFSAGVKAVAGPSQGMGK
jgi:nucleoid-associated protein YgaU